MCDPVTAGVVLEAGAAEAGVAAVASAPAAMGAFGAAGASTAAAVEGGGILSGMSGWQMVSSGLGMASSVMGGQAREDQANYEAGVARNNQITAGYAADDARRRAELDAQKIQRQTAQLAGSQRAAFAAKGLDVSEGTPGDVIDQTNFFGDIDAKTARYNGKVEAWQKTTQAQNFGAQGDAASARAGSAMTGSLISGAGMVADRWAYNRRVV